MGMHTHVCGGLEQKYIGGEEVSIPHPGCEIHVRSMMVCANGEKAQAVKT